MTVKTWMISSNLAAGADDNPEHPNAIPADDKWAIDRFTFADINTGDSKSSIYVLRFGTDILEFGTVTGSTDSIDVNEEIVGDGVKKINVLRYNTSGSTKKLPFKVKAKKRN